VSVKRLHVAAAVILDQAGRVLIAKRPEHLHQGGLWEFPGGKIEAGESVEDALQRELTEEVSLFATKTRPFIRIHHDYPDKKVLLDVWLVEEFTGEAYGVEGQDIRWIERERLQEYRFPAANAPIVRAAQLPSRYLITPEPGKPEQWDGYLTGLRHSIQQGVSLLQFRAKSLSHSVYRELAENVIAIGHENKCRVLLNAKPELALELGADGVHMTSSLLDTMSRRPLPDSYLVAASCHNRHELDKAMGVQCDFAVLGPVKQTLSHPEQEALGWAQFRYLTDTSILPVYALGGMNESDLGDAWRHGAQGVAAIRSFWKGSV